MGVSIRVTKVEESPEACVYAFGSGGDPVGRVRLDKATGDVELLALNENPEGPSEQYCLAHVVPRLHTYHDRETYPASDQWDG